MNGGETGDNGGGWSDELREEYRDAFATSARAETRAIVELFPDKAFNNSSVSREDFQPNEDKDYTGMNEIIDDNQGSSGPNGGVDETEEEYNKNSQGADSLSNWFGRTILRRGTLDSAGAFLNALDLLYRGIDYFGSNGLDEFDPEKSLIDISLITQLCQQRLHSLKTSIIGGTANKLKGIFGWIKNRIQSISMKLWKLVSSHLNLDEWTVSGGVVTSLFGLPNADVSLTFT